jgi:hypothetical protein
VSLLSIEGNPITAKELQALDGFAAYEARYTASRKKIEAAQKL